MKFLIFAFALSLTSFSSWADECRENFNKGYYEIQLSIGAKNEANKRWAKAVRTESCNDVYETIDAVHMTLEHLADGIGAYSMVTKDCGGYSNAKDNLLMAKNLQTSTRDLLKTAKNAFEILRCSF